MRLNLTGALGWLLLVVALALSMAAPVLPAYVGLSAVALAVLAGALINLARTANREDADA